MRLSVIGTGYLGATHAACMADLGHDVLALDTDPQKLQMLADGQVPFHEPGLTDVLHRALASGRLRFTTSFAEVAEWADVHFLCVGTPQRDSSGAADLSQVNGAIASLAEHLTRPSLVVGKSTVPVGNAARLTAEIADTSPAGDQAHLAWNPEFLREGHAVADTVRPDRLVVGVSHPADAEILHEVYAPVLDHGVPWLVTDLATAELVKTASNAFLATKISFINAMAELCEATGADVTALADAMGLDERIGRRFLGAGLGFGGGCLPKDIRAFQARAQELGMGQSLEFLGAVDQINARCRTRAAEAAVNLLGENIANARVCILGAAFKPNSDDVRDSPALDVARDLHERGASVVIYDPHAMANAAELLPQVTFADSATAALTDAQVVLLLTEWQEFCILDPHEVGELVKARKVVDARNALPTQQWLDAGWIVHALGRGTLSPSAAQ